MTTDKKPKPTRPRSLWRRLGLFFKRQKLNLIGALPLGLFLPMIVLMASLGPDDVSKNMAKWPSALGWYKFAAWLELYATGPRVLWGSLILCFIYGAVVWGLPALIYRTKKQTAVILVPVAALLIIGFVAVGGFVIGQQDPPDWHITAAQSQKLREILKGQEKFDFAIILVPGQTSSIPLAYDLMNIFGYGNGWSVGVLPYDAEHAPTTTGMAVAVRTGSDFKANANALRLKAILQDAGFVVKETNDRRLPENAVAIVLGRRQ